jgi:Signal peptidase, peptidase S26
LKQKDIVRENVTQEKKQTGEERQRRDPSKREHSRRNGAAFPFMASTTKTKGPSPEPAKPIDPRGKGSPTPRTAPSPPETARPSAMRETIESIVVAFILAFMFKTFEAEAFVIPTGSMAPTLYGRNKSALCPKCGTEFTIGASDEVETDTDYVIPGARIDSAICPNCRYRLDKDDV